MNQFGDRRRRMQKAKLKVAAILKKAKTSNVRLRDLEQLEVLKLMRKKPKPKRYRIIYTCCVILLVLYSSSFFNFKSKCLMDMPPSATKVFREAEDCSMCKDVTKVDKVRNISKDEFDRYLEEARPLVVTDGMRDWSDPKVFNFYFLKELYLNNERDTQRKTCQFFPYKSGFQSLEEVFQMDDERANLAPGTKRWYVGWSNCNDAAGKELSKHIKMPYFIPDISEPIALSWIFMGGPGEGAHMHVDNVQFPSWQAQLSGRKTWRLAPPPECIYSCQEFKVTVEPGEIIVLDTNRWYHQTHVLPGEISITIGAEFD